MGAKAQSNRGSTSQSSSGAAVQYVDTKLNFRVAKATNSNQNPKSGTTRGSTGPGPDSSGGFEPFQTITSTVPLKSKAASSTVAG